MGLIRSICSLFYGRPERIRDELRVLVYDAMAERDRTEGKTEPPEEQGVHAAAEERTAESAADGTEEGGVSRGLVEKAGSGVAGTEAQDLKGSEVSAVEVETSPLSAGVEEEEEEEEAQGITGSAKPCAWESRSSGWWHHLVAECLLHSWG